MTTASDPDVRATTEADDAAAPGAVAGTGRAPRSPGGLGVVLRAAWGLARTKVGLVLLVVTLLLAVFGPMFAPHAIDQFVGRPFAKPSSAFPLGTDTLGRDVLSRVLNGGWSVVWMSLAAATLGMLLGVTVGLTAAFHRGWVDEALMRTMDVLLALPLIVFVLLFVSMLGRAEWLIVLLVAISHAPQVARVTRAVAADVREREFVQSAEALGISSTRIMFGEIIPNLSTPLLVEYGLRIVWSIAGIASLSLLGQGIQAPKADWGLMINENRTAISVQPWAVLAPLLCIAIFALGTNLVTDGIGRAASRPAAGKE